MAVVQLRSGIYVNTIEPVPPAEQTAAYKYASLFTKHRKENWEMAQKQAAREIADAKVRDAALLKNYGQQLQDYNDRLQQLDKDIAAAGTDVAKANSATQRTALQEAVARQKNAQDWAKAQAEQVSVAGGSRSSSKSTGTSVSSGGGGGGGGAGGGTAGKGASDAVNTTIATVGTDDPSALATAINNGPLSAAVISNTDPKVITASKAGAVSAAVTNRATEYRNSGYTEDEAQTQAENDIKQNLIDGGHQDYVDSYDKQLSVDMTGGGGGRTSTSERASSSYSVREPATLQPRYKGLGEQPDLIITTPSVSVNTTVLEAKRKELAGQLADLIKQGAPASTVDDFITRSREIMAGRFGSVQTSPNYYQRNAAQRIGTMNDADAQALLEKFRSSAEGAPVRITPTTPVTTAAQASPVSPGATQAGGPIVTDGSTPTVSPGASGANVATAPTTAASSAASTAAASGAPPSAIGAAAGAAAAAVPSTSETVMNVENRRPGNYPIRQKELDNLFPEGVPQEILDAAAGIKKSTPSEVSGPSMAYPGGTADTSSMPARNSVYFPTTATAIGRKPEAVGDFSVPDMPRETETPAPGSKDFIPNSLYMPPVQPGGNVTWEQKGYVEPSEQEKQQILDIKQKQREKREVPTGKTGYFQQRFENAKEIVDQPGRLARLTASGPGKVAADVYNANKASGKDFKLTYDTLTAAYEDDKEALASAHQVALALDIASRNRTASPKA